MGAVAGAVAGTALSDLVNEGMGLLFSNTNNTIQQHQQQALTNIGLGAAESLSQFNTQQQLNLWNQTNYPAQVAQLNQAGLNPALLYSKGGMGGTTGSPTGGIPAAQAPGTALPQMAAQGMNLANIQADIDLKKAQADNIKARTPGEAPLMGAQTANLTQGVENMKAQQMLTQLQSRSQQIQNNIQGSTQDDAIAQIKAFASEVESQSQQAVRNNYIDQQTMNDKIATIRGQMLQTFIQNENIRANTKLTNEQITNIVNQIQQNWKDLDIKQQNTNINMSQKNINQQDANTREYNLKLQQFIHNLPDTEAQMQDALIKLIPSIGLGMGTYGKLENTSPRNPVGFKY